MENKARLLKEELRLLADGSLTKHSSLSCGFDKSLSYLSNLIRILIRIEMRAGLILTMNEKCKLIKKFDILEFNLNLIQFY